MFVIARLINRPATIDELIERGAWPTDDTFDPRSIAAVLTTARARAEESSTGYKYRAASPERQPPRGGGPDRARPLACGATGVRRICCGAADAPARCTPS